MFDSVFSKFLADKLPLGEKKVLSDLDALQSKSAIFLNATIYTAANNLIKKLDNPLKNQDLAIIQNCQWNLIPQLERSLWAIWNEGWRTGGEHGDKEIELNSRVADFAKKNVKEKSLRNQPAEKAVRSRINKLAKDVSKSEFNRIKKHLLAATSPQRSTGQPISRTELVKRINSELGTKGSRFSRRAETIARTELTFAYNAGRLQTYRDSGLVEAVRFYTILDERRCPICASRQGLVMPLDDWLLVSKNTPPLHPNCRCVLSPILKKQVSILSDPNRKAENMSLVQRPDAWAAAALLAIILLEGKGGASLLGVVPVIAATQKLVEAIEKKPFKEKALVEAIEKKSDQKAGVSVNPLAQQEAVSSTQQPSLTKPVVMVGDIDLNTASMEQLLTLLPGRYLNVRQARSLIRYRSKTPLQSIDDVAKVPEIGARTYARLKQLQENTDIFTILSPENIKTPAQLWAANLGLTRAQARTIFEEMSANGAYSNIEDLQQRLSGKGIGKKTIQNLRRRLIIVKSQEVSPQTQIPIQNPIIPENPESGEMWRTEYSARPLSRDFSLSGGSRLNFFSRIRNKNLRFFRR